MILEIRGGFTSLSSKLYLNLKTDFMFDMKGKKIPLSARVIPEMFQEFQEKSGISKDARRFYIIPHR